jgi:alkanesulfonate monooxygenase SsuD/methylene tetrahydromethanopterin reductase-like flavin-dependent oxidoreductase (luciferase family)
MAKKTEKKADPAPYPAPLTHENMGAFARAVAEFAESLQRDALIVQVVARLRHVATETRASDLRAWDGSVAARLEEIAAEVDRQRQAGFFQRLDLQEPIEAVAQVEREQCIEILRHAGYREAAAYLGARHPDRTTHATRLAGPTQVADALKASAR